MYYDSLSEVCLYLGRYRKRSGTVRAARIQIMTRGNKRSITTRRYISNVMEDIPTSILFKTPIFISLVIQPSFYADIFNIGKSHEYV